VDADVPAASGALLAPIMRAAGRDAGSHLLVIKFNCIAVNFLTHKSLS
jgi:hypothetical protein